MQTATIYQINGDQQPTTQNERKFELRLVDYKPSHPRPKETILSFKKTKPIIAISKRELQHFLLHRRNALKIDGVVFHPSDEKTIRGYKKVKESDPDLDGHFDGKPMYPGVITAECACQTAAMLILLTNDNLSGYPTVASLYCDFKRPILVNDEIEIKVELLEKEQQPRGRLLYHFCFTVSKLCNGKIKVVTEGKITGTAT